MLKIGQRVIVRSNEDEPLLIGKIVGFDDFGGKSASSFPIVEHEGDGTHYVVMGIVRLWSKETEEFLQQFTPQEQWDLLKEEGQ